MSRHACWQMRRRATSRKNKPSWLTPSCQLLIFRWIAKLCTSWHRDRNDFEGEKIPGSYLPGIFVFGAPSFFVADHALFTVASHFCSVALFDSSGAGHFCAG